jgi:hypothetical protein
MRRKAEAAPTDISDKGAVVPVKKPTPVGAAVPVTLPCPRATLLVYFAFAPTPIATALAAVLDTTDN